MTSAERTLLSKELFICAQYYGKTDISPEQLSSTITLLDRFFNKPVTVYVRAIENYMRDPKNKFYPAPAQLAPYINPEIEKKDVAIDLARAIIGAIRRYQHGWQSGYCGINGPYWIYKNQDFPSWEAAAKEEIGELGIEVVKRYGWNNLCESYFNSQEGMFQAQLREYILARQNIISIGAAENIFKLPQAKGVADFLNTANDMNKKLGWKEEREATTPVMAIPENGETNDVG